MGVIFESGYALPASDEPLDRARIAHSGNWLTGGTVTASSTDGDFFAEGPNNSLTYERWKPTSLTATWEYDHGSTSECDYCVIGAHTMGTNGNTLRVQYYNGSSWTNLIPATALTDDTDIYVVFEPETRQRWRINIQGGAVPEVGVIKFGKSLQLERPVAGTHTPLAYARQTELTSTMSATGEFLGLTKQRMALRTTFQWNFLTPTWIEANWPGFQRAVEDEPFFIAWRPGDYSEASLCKAEAPPTVQFTGSRDFMSASVNVVGYGYE